MSFLVSWHIPNRVYVVQAWGDISLDELQHGSDTAIEFVRAGTAPVHCIGDARYIRKTPLELTQLRRATQILREPNLGYFLFLSNNHILNMFGSALSKMASVKFNSFTDPDILISVLQDLDSSLPSLPTYTFSDPTLEDE